MLLCSIHSRLININQTLVTDTTKQQLKEYSYNQQYLYVLFIFIIINNIISNVPYSFTTTAQFITSFSLSIVIFYGMVFIGIYYHKSKYFNILLPSGVPLILSPLLVSIESLSLSSRIVSLAVRLSANLISGHTLMHMIAVGCANLIFINLLIILFPIPTAILFALSIIELAISYLQAYVFVLLSLSYFHDSVFLH